MGEIILPNNTPDDRYTIQGDVAFDTLTGLTWERFAMGRSADNWLSAQALLMDWDMAMQQGGDGWRLPSLDELQTLVSSSGQNPAINRHIFPDVGVNGPWWYWSSTPYLKDAAGAWAVHFGTGGSGYVFPHKKGMVRLVRKDA